MPFFRFRKWNFYCWETGLTLKHNTQQKQKKKPRSEYCSNRLQLTFCHRGSVFTVLLYLTVYKIIWKVLDFNEIFRQHGYWDKEQIIKCWWWIGTPYCINDPILPWWRYVFSECASSSKTHQSWSIFPVLLTKKELVNSSNDKQFYLTMSKTLGYFRLCLTKACQ